MLKRPSKPTPAWIALLLAALWPSNAAAAESGASQGQSGSEIGAVVSLVLLVAFAYLGAHFVVDRLQRRFLVISGLEYILLGVLLGSIVPEIGPVGEMTGVLPIIALAAGWVGLLRGSDFDLASLRRNEQGTASIVFLHHTIPGVLVGVVAYWGLLMLQPELATRDAAIAAVFLGCCAGTDSSGPFDLLARRYEISGKLAPLLKHATRMGDILVVLVFGVIFCIFRDGPAETWAKSPADWSVVMVGLGITLGVLFTTFLGGDESDHSRFLALVGIIAFASGAAYFLNLSPLAVNLILGIVLVNAARDGHLIHSTLVSTERPMALVLLVFAGTLWRPTALLPTVAGLFVFILLRVAGKALGSVLAGWGSSLRSDLFRGLLAHGEVTVAMAVSFQLVYDGPGADLAYSIALGSIVFHDLIAPRALRGLLVDEGEVQREIQPAVTAGAG